MSNQDESIERLKVENVGSISIEVTEEMSRDPNLDSESSSVIDYTYHRHSAPKDVIYYRCSDKRCPARVLYNQLTKSFTLKNQHLNPRIHRKPSTQKPITSHELISFPNNSMRGPLVISKLHMPLKSESNQEFPNIPCKRPLDDALLDSVDDKIYLIQLKLNQIDNFDLFSKEIIEKCLATKLQTYNHVKKYTFQKCEMVSQQTLEIYTSSHFMGKVLLLINKHFGRGADFTIFQKE
jgi:FLYWCH zinc finger domain